MLSRPKEVHALHRTLLVVIVVLLEVFLLDILPLALEHGQLLALVFLF